MGPTLPSDFAFAPKVWSDHVTAYFDRLLQFGALAVQDKTLTAQPGTTVNFPYYKKIGAAQKPAVTDSLVVDKIQDDAFSCTVLEVAKAVGLRKGALYVSADKREGVISEVQSQLGRVLAEQVDADIITEINTSGNYTSGFVSANNTELCNIRRILQGKITAFGDKQDQAVAIFMHSQHYLDVMTDSTAGFLAASANDPFWGSPGFIGRLLGMALFTNDNVPAAADIGGKKAYELFVMKANPYGIISKQDMDMAMDYDMLAREWLFAADQWYGVKALHGKVASDDKRIARMTFVTQVTA